MKAKNIIALVAAFAVASAAGIFGKKQYDHYQDGKPYLVGHCFMMKEDGSYLMIPQTTEATRQDNGQKETVYLGVVLVMGGLIQIPMPLEIRTTNEAVRKLKSEDAIEEVNCETGEPLESK